MALVALTFLLLHANTDGPFAPARSAPQLSINPKLSPEYVEMLKQQAEAKKTFYSDQARTVKERRDANKRERAELIERHRQARAEFGKERHSSEEREAFFRSQRSEMAALKAKQKEDMRALNAELQKKLGDFKSQQRDERGTLRDKLVQQSKESRQSRN